MDTDRLDKQLGKDVINTKYDYDVSFVGNMNTNLNNILMSDEIPSYYEGYINGLAQVQQKYMDIMLLMKLWIRNGFADI